VVGKQKMDGARPRDSISEPLPSLKVQTSKFQNFI
jgi:hypothetical protein